MTIPGKQRSEVMLRFVLRYIGTVAMLALVAVFMPYSWMDATHAWLGMGRLPSEPVVGYLARSLSLFYAFLGGLLWLCSTDVHRHRVVLRYLGGAFVGFGAIMWGVDFAERLPDFWKHVEGPMVIVFGSIIWFLSSRLRQRASPIGD
jgi:hypothetical protein